MSGQRYSLQQRIWIVEKKILLKYPVSIRRAWQKNYTSTPPTTQTIHNLFNKWKLTGSVADSEKLGQPTSITTEVNIVRVSQFYSETPQTSSRRASHQLQISQTSIRRIINSTFLD